MIKSRSICNGFATFDGDLFNHMVRVLRLGHGDPLLLVDENGVEYEGVINQVARDWVVVKIMASPKVSTITSAPRITICQALPKGEKTELILQKGTELGVHDFWLFGGCRSVARIREDQLTAKLERWKRVTAEAARQCGRRTIPDIKWFKSAKEAADLADHEVRLLLWEGERTNRLKQILAGHATPASTIVAIGPEGGFDPLEVAHFSSRLFQPVSLGERILRTETASLAITAILQYIWEDI